MARLFLSYSRKDEARARRFTAWLEREGYAVWRDDEDIGGGASFSSEIENALKQCDAVLVLWSADSIKSAWVRDEAGYGRDAGKLIPFSLDGTEPPLGFRQFQAISLRKWKAGEPENADRIRHAIGRFAGASQGLAAAHAGGSRRFPTKLSGRPLLVGGAIALLAAVLLAWFLWQPWSDDRQVAIAVLPAPQSSDRVMATDYANVAAADMAAFLPRRFDRARVITPAEVTGQVSGYRMVVSTNPHGNAAIASLTLTDTDGHTILWSKNWSVADASAANLKQEVSATASKAALCLTDATGGSTRLSEPAIGMYLSGCTGIGGDSQLSDVDFRTIFERVTKLAPDFAPGWAYLGLSRANFAQDHQDGSASAYAADVQSAREAIAVARRMNPKSALTYHAEYHLISNDHVRALEVIERAAGLDPNDGLVQMHLSDELMSVGRTSESVQAAQSAVELEPSSPFAKSQYILALVYSGQFTKAQAEIAKARKMWPSDPAIDYAELAYQFRYGDPRAALPLLPATNASSDAAMAPYRKLIAARLDPTAGKIDEAIEALKAARPNDPLTKNRVLQALGNFGRVQQTYQLLDDPEFRPFVDTAILFRPDFAKVRADPRFMQIAARLGLIRYWRRSGSWPDFCTSEQLRYDCKAEAAKYVN